MDDGQAEFTSTTDSELIAFALQQAVDRGLDWAAAIRAALALCKGAFSLVIGTPEGLFAVRDGHGIRPLVFGQLGEPDSGHWVVSSETCGLEIIGASYTDDVQPGELVHFQLGVDQPQRVQWSDEPNRLCVFEMIYFARPDSRFFGERWQLPAPSSNVGPGIRCGCGSGHRCRIQEFRQPSVSQVSGIPMPMV